MSVASAFEKLVDIAQRSHRFAVDLPAQEEARTYWSGIGFSLHGQHYVSPMDEVAEILSVPRYTQVPGVQGWVRGVANVRGRLLPIMDLNLYFDSPSASNRRRRLLVLDHGELYSGLIVDEVFGMQHFPVDEFTDVLPSHYKSMRKYLKGGYRLGGEVWAVFSLFKLAEDPRFLNVAS